jgi:predicted N-acetyltransferase YhbS
VEFEISLRFLEASVMAIDYQVVSPRDVKVDELLEFYERQSHETTESAEKLQEMIQRSCCFVWARDDGRLIGIARGVADGVRGYLAECKLDPTYQGPAALTRTDGRIEHDEHGIGKEMGRRVLEFFREMGVERVEVLAHGTEEDFCTELGFKKARGVVPMQLDLKSMALCSAGS